MVVSVPASQGDGSGIDGPYPAAIALSTLSLVVALLITPTLFQHYRNRNLGATALVADVIICNMISFVNAILWANDDMTNWYNGIGLCDIEVKLSLFFRSMFPASLLCILRALANVMNTDNSSWMQTQAQKRRNCAIDIVCCIVVPASQMILHYIVQPNRYIIYGISGCTPTIDSSWLSFVLVTLWPLVWVLADVYYSIVIMIRLVRYRLTFNSILVNSSTTKSRFVRLYLLCLVSILMLVPLEIYVLIRHQLERLTAYSWNATHHPTDHIWNSALLIRSNGRIFYDRYMWLGGGFLIFLFFGFGKDAVKSYRTILLAMKLDRIFPSIRLGASRRPSAVATATSSIGSKARLFFKRKESNATWTSSSDATSASTPSPKKMTFLESIREDNKHGPRLHINTTTQHKTAGPFPSLTSLFKKDTKKPSFSNDPFTLTNVSSPTRRFDTSVSAEPPSPTMCTHVHSHSRSDGDVLVRKEVRQASETAETLPQKMYGGV